MSPRTPRLESLAEEGDVLEKATSTIDCKFRMHYQAPFGQSLYLAGSDPAMGAWNLNNAVLMNWQPNDFWVADVALSRLIPAEYKYVVLTDFGAVVRWEEGPNHVISMPHYDNSTLKVYDHWGSK